MYRVVKNKGRGGREGKGGEGRGRGVVKAVWGLGLELLGYGLEGLKPLIAGILGKALHPWRLKSSPTLQTTGGMLFRWFSFGLLVALFLALKPRVLRSLAEE